MANYFPISLFPYDIELFGDVSGGVTLTGDLLHEVYASGWHGTSRRAWFQPFFIDALKEYREFSELDYLTSDWRLLPNEALPQLASRMEAWLSMIANAPDRLLQVAKYDLGDEAAIIRSIAKADVERDMDDDSIYSGGIFTFMRSHAAGLTEIGKSGRDALFVGAETWYNSARQQ